MRATLSYASVLLLVCSVSAEQPGLVGIFVKTAPDFRVITMVTPDSPAAHAGVQVGDRIVAIDDWSTSEVHSAQELVTRASGAADTEIEVQLERSGVAFRVRMRRVPAPAPHTTPSPIPDPSGYQASSDAIGLTRRWS